MPLVAIPIIAILMPVLILLIIAGAFLLVIRIIFGSKGDDRNAMNQEETRMMQEVFQGFERMDKRIEALETILLDEHKPTERKPDHEA